MCGIAGFVGPLAPGLDGHTARRMAELLRHRGPDDEGVWTDPEAGVALAQRRLAIVDTSAAGHQPMVSPSGRYVIVFNGEIYNHGEIRALLDAESSDGMAGPFRHRGAARCDRSLGPHRCARPVGRHVCAGTLGPSRALPQPRPRPDGREAAVLWPDRPKLRLRLGDQGLPGAQRMAAGDRPRKPGTSDAP